MHHAPSCGKNTLLSVLLVTHVYTVLSGSLGSRSAHVSLFMALSFFLGCGALSNLGVINSVLPCNNCACHVNSAMFIMMLYIVHVSVWILLFCIAMVCVLSYVVSLSFFFFFCFYFCLFVDLCGDVCFFIVGGMGGRGWGLFCPFTLYYMGTWVGPWNIPVL